MVVVCAVVLFYALFSSFVQCSGIITRSMIRMPNGSFGASRTMTPSNQLPKPEMLASRPADVELQAVHPFKAEEEERNNGIQSLVLDKSAVLDKNLVENFVQLSSPKGFFNSTIPLNENHATKVIEREETKKVDNRLEDSVEKLNTTISPKELSSKYWMKYNNFSQEYFNRFRYQDSPKNETNLEKRYPENSVLEILQRIFSCFWSSEVFSCVQDSFGDSSFESFSLFHLMSPRLPRFQIEDDLQEGFTNRNGDFEYRMVEEDEGRKKLSKKILELLPFLMMLKMTMLPALAVMALVSGKAFLVSLLSLGVALVATFSSAAPFSSADKRHEIAPQSPPSSHPAEQLPGKYYYVM